MDITKFGILVLAFVSLAFTVAYGQELDNGQIPFYAEPWYNYKPLTIHVGKYSDALKTTDATELIALSQKIKLQIDSVNIETLFILSIRLFDMGKRDESFYWLQTAKARARIFIDMLDPAHIGSIGEVAFELKTFFSAFSQAVGGYINAHGFNDIEKGASVLEQIKNEVPKIKSYKSVYKTVVFLPDASLEEIKTKREKELEKSITYMRANKDELKKERIKAGLQDKY